MEHTITIRVRYPECDPMGILHHSIYLQYFEMGRVELLRANGFVYAELEKQGIMFVVIKVEIRYRAPARYDEELVLTTRIKRQTAVRIDHEYELKRPENPSGQTIIAEGATTIACVGADGELKQIPDFLSVR